MYHWMDGWGWFWMSFMMVFWVVVLGVVVYSRRPIRQLHSGVCVLMNDLDDARPRVRRPRGQIGGSAVIGVAVPELF